MLDYFTALPTKSYLILKRITFGLLGNHEPISYFEAEASRVIWRKIGLISQENGNLGAVQIPEYVQIRTESRLFRSCALTSPPFFPVLLLNQPNGQRRRLHCYRLKRFNHHITYCTSADPKRKSKGSRTLFSSYKSKQ